MHCRCCFQPLFRITPALDTGRSATQCPFDPGLNLGPLPPCIANTFYAFLNLFRRTCPLYVFSTCNRTAPQFSSYVLSALFHVRLSAWSRVRTGVAACPYSGHVAGPHVVFLSCPSRNSFRRLRHRAIQFAVPNPNWSSQSQSDFSGLVAQQVALPGGSLNLLRTG